MIVLCSKCKKELTSEEILEHSCNICKVILDEVIRFDNGLAKTVRYFQIPKYYIRDLQRKEKRK